MSHISLASLNYKPVTIPRLLKKKAKGEKIVSITAYDYTFAKIIDELKVVDFILVGDSAASVIQGHNTTLPMTLEQMIYHSRCVSSACNYSLVIGDMPFLTYETSSKDAVYNAGRLIKEGGVSAVKLEGGKQIASTVEKLVNANIPVMGHIGLTPQAVNKMGGFVVQGKSRASYNVKSKESLLEDAKALESAGAFAVVVEGVPDSAAELITDSIDIPTIGIGAGGKCDGQILVLYDLLGLTTGKKPKFVKEFASLKSEVEKAVLNYAKEVENGDFPSLEHCYTELKRDENNERVNKSSAL